METRLTQLSVLTTQQMVITQANFILTEPLGIIGRQCDTKKKVWSVKILKLK